MPTSSESISERTPISEQHFRETKAKEPEGPGEPTTADLARAEEKAGVYYKALVDSIYELDDGISPAESIARAAVSNNIEKLRDWKRSQMAHLARPSKWYAEQVETRLVKMPVQANIDDATSVVLQVRKRVKARSSPTVKMPERTKVPGPADVEKQRAYLEYLRKIKAEQDANADPAAQ